MISAFNNLQIKLSLHNYITRLRKIEMKIDRNDSAVDKAQEVYDEHVA